MKWGIIGAMDAEVALLKEKIENETQTIIAGMTFYEGKLGNMDVVLTKSGAGKVFAAMAAQILIDKFNVSHLINTGVAGGLDNRLQVEDIVVATDAIQHDFNVTALGETYGHVMGEDLTVPTRFQADEELIALFEAEASKLGYRYLKGTIVSGDIFIQGAAKKKKLFDRFEATAAEMEGASVAQVAVCNQIPFLIIRSISDLADGSAPESYDVFKPRAAKIAASLIIAMANKA